ncbi:MAG TPA: Txe/YoeB family addiction module toxin [Gammaproteobacteria bacterium]|nr:Txe/YoeB family addiction module toxin [Gammaproteobacteria bacterium]
MKLAWTDLAWEDYLYWQQTDITKARRINDLIKDIKRSPFQGIGKPEPLKFDLAGKWSRKIDAEHRLVYEVNGKKEEQKRSIVDSRILTIIQCRYHYN